MIANAGIGGTMKGPNIRNPRRLEKTDVNLMGAVNSIHGRLPQMLERRSGHPCRDLKPRRFFAAAKNRQPIRPAKAGMTAFFESVGSMSHIKALM